jgi:molybdopterin synthase sulfur carrier subunit
MPKVVLPNTLTELFPGIPRRVELDASSVQEVVDQLDARYPGMRNRICDGAAGGGGNGTVTIRRHLLIFVDDERSDLSTSVSPGSEVRIIPALSGG